MQARDGVEGVFGDGAALSGGVPGGVQCLLEGEHVVAVIAQVEVAVQRQRTLQYEDGVGTNDADEVTGLEHVAGLLVLVDEHRLTVGARANRGGLSGLGGSGNGEALADGSFFNLRPDRNHGFRLHGRVGARGGVAGAQVEGQHERADGEDSQQQEHAGSGDALAEAVPAVLVFRVSGHGGVFLNCVSAVYFSALYFVALSFSAPVYWCSRTYCLNFSSRSRSALRSCSSCAWYLRMSGIWYCASRS